MARMADIRKAGKLYDVTISMGKHGQKVGTFRVKAATPKQARKLAIAEAGNAENLHAHAPRLAA